MKNLIHNSLLVFFPYFDGIRRVLLWALVFDAHFSPRDECTNACMSLPSEPCRHSSLEPVYDLGIRDFLAMITLIFMILPDRGHAYYHENHNHLDNHGFF